MLQAANLGDDADTTAAIVGQIAGAHYGIAWCGLFIEALSPKAAVVVGLFNWQTAEGTGQYSYSALLVRENGDLRIRVEDVAETDTIAKFLKKACLSNSAMPLITLPQTAAIGAARPDSNVLKLSHLRVQPVLPSRTNSSS